MILLIIYILAYMLAGAPTIHSVEGWVVFGVIAIAFSVWDAITDIKPQIYMNVNGSPVEAEIDEWEDDDDE